MRRCGEEEVRVGGEEVVWSLASVNECQHDQQGNGGVTTYEASAHEQYV